MNSAKGSMFNKGAMLTGGNLYPSKPAHPYSCQPNIFAPTAYENALTAVCICAPSSFMGSGSSAQTFLLAQQPARTSLALTISN